MTQDDPEWFWVLRADGAEGFVPAGFVYPLDAIQQNKRHQSSLSAGHSAAQPLPGLPLAGLPLARWVRG